MSGNSARQPLRGARSQQAGAPRPRAPRNQPAPPTAPARQRVRAQVATSPVVLARNFWELFHAIVLNTGNTVRASVLILAVLIGIAAPTSVVAATMGPAAATAVGAVTSTLTAAAGGAAWVARRRALKADGNSTPSTDTPSTESSAAASA